MRLKRPIARASLLASVSVAAVALCAAPVALADVYNVGGGTITTTQTDNSVDNTGAGGPFLLRPNTITGGDAVDISGVTLTNTLGGLNGRAIDLGYSLASSGSYSVTMSGSTLTGNAASGTAAIMASTTVGTVTFDSTGGTANTIAGALGITVAGQGPGNVNVVIKTGADVVTTSGFTGEVLYGVSQGAGTVSIDTVGATLTGGGLYGISASSYNSITMGALNGGIASTINVAGGAGIYTGGISDVSITLAASGSITAAQGMSLGGDEVVVNSFGTITATGTWAINAGLANRFTVTLQDGSVTVGQVAGGANADTFNISAGADITSASFYGAGGSDQLVLTGAGTGTLDLSTLLQIEVLQKSGSGTWILTGGSFAGTTTVSAGTLQLDAGAGISNSAALTVNGGTFDLNDNNQTVGALSGTGGAIDLGSGDLRALSSANTVLASVISGTGGFFKDGSGSLTLSGANTYSGGTVLDAGTLVIGAGTVGGPGAIVSSAIGISSLEVNGGTLGAAGNFTLSNDILVMNGANFQLDTGGNTLTLDGSIFFGATEGIVKSGSGILAVATQLNNSGDTTINAGTLRAGGAAIFSPNSNFSVASGGTLDIGGNDQDIGSLAGAGIVTNSGANATLFVGNFGTNTQDTVFSGVIQDGAGSVRLYADMDATGSLTLTGANTYTGGTFICDCSTLQIGNGGATGSILGDVENHGTLIFNRSDAYTFAGGIVELGGTSGVVIKNGAGTLTLTGNSDYSGGTIVIAGQLLAGSDAALGVGEVVLSGGSTLGVADNVLVANDITVDANAKFDIAAGAIGEISGSISDGTGANGIAKTGGGTLILSSLTNDYTGGTTINAGTLFVADDGNLGDVFGAVTINGATLKLGDFVALDEDRSIILTSNGGTLDTEAAFSQTGGTITGAGRLTVTGAGGYIGNFGINDYSGGTRVIGGATLLIEAEENLGAVSGGLSLDNGGLSFYLADVTLDANRTVTLGPGGGFVSVTAPASEIAGTITGSGSLTVMLDAVALLGGGDLYLTGINNYTGGTILRGLSAFAAPASLVIVDDRNLGAANGAVSIDLGEILFDADVTLNAARNIVVTGDGALFDVDDNVVTIAGVISGGGPVAKDGDGTLILTANNTNTGMVDIVDGTLQLGNGGTTGSLAAGVVTSSGTLVFNRSNTLVLAADISDFCGCFGAIVTQAGSGATILTGTSTYTGGTNIDAGTLQIGNGGTSGSITGDVANSGALVFNRSDTISFAGIVSGSGTLTQAGSGILTIDGVNTYTGNTVVTAGILRLGAGASLGTGGLVLNGGQFDLNGGTLTLTSLSGDGGTLNLGTGTLNVNIAGNGTLASNIIGTGGLIKNGTGVMTLSGDNSGFSGGITIAGGTVNFATSNSTGTGPITTTGSVIDYANGITVNAGININSNTTQLQVVAGTATQAGVISETAGPRPLEKIGDGTLVLTAINAYTGVTTITQGTLQLGNGGTGGFINDTTVVNSGILAFNRSDNVFYSGVISGAGSVVMNGSGILTLQAANTYTGATLVNTGTLRAGNNGLNSLSDHTVAAGAAIDLAGRDASVRSLSGAGTVTNSSAVAGSTLQAGNSGNTVFSGIIQDGSFLVRLTKNGAGTLTLTGANTYTGVTTITAGTLQVGNGGTTGSVTGDIVNNANLIFNRSDDIVFSGSISGSGGLTKLGAGGLTLAGAGTLTGDTTVGAGALTVNGSIASSAVTVANGATLGGIGTVGAVTVQSGGTLSPGNNGIGTLAVNGNLTLQAGSSLGIEAGPGGADRITVTGNASLAGSLFANFQTGVTYPAGQTSYTLVSATGTVSGTFSSFNTLGIPNGYRADIVYGSNSLVLNLTPNDFIWSATAASSDWNTASNWTYGLVPDVTRTAEFSASSRTNVTVAANAGARTIQLNSGAPSYNFTVTGSTLTIAEGVVQLTSNASSFIAGSGGTIAFNGSGSAGGSLLTAGTGGTVSFAGTAHPGMGAQIVVQSGGMVDFSGTTGPGAANDIRAGSIAGAGSIRLGANRLNTGEAGASTEFSGVISGTGGLFKSGAGTLILSGVNTYTGATTVSAGTLVVNGALASNVTLAGGALKGTGSIAGLTANAGSTVAPGNSIGTLNAGTVSFASGSTYEAEVNAAGQADLFHVTGSASLNGAVQVLAAAGSYAPVTTYRILNAGSISGTFTSVTSNQSDLTPSLVYSANAVDLRLLRNNLQFGNAYGTTPNQVAAGGGVSAGGAGSALYVAIANGYTAASIGATLDGLSGEIYASERSAALQDSRIIRNTVMARLAANPEGTGGWAYGFADSGMLESDGNAGEGARQNAGLIGGVDFMLGDGLRLGVGGAYAENKLNIASRASTAHGHLGSLLAYVSYRRDAFSLNLGGDYGWGESGAVRTLSVPAATASADRNVEAGSIFAQASYDFGLPVIPYAGITHVTLSHGGFTETGGIAALSGGASSDQETYSVLGVRAPVGSFDLHGMTLTPRIDIGWSHAFAAAAPAQQVRFPTLQGFTVLGAPIGSDAAALQLGLDLAIIPGATLSAGYDGTFSGRGNSHAVRGGLNWRF